MTWQASLEETCCRRRGRRSCAGTEGEQRRQVPPFTHRPPLGCSHCSPKHLCKVQPWQCSRDEQEEKTCFFCFFHLLLFLSLFLFFLISFFFSISYFSLFPSLSLSPATPQRVSQSRGAINNHRSFFREKTPEVKAFMKVAHAMSPLIPHHLVSVTPQHLEQDVAAATGQQQLPVQAEVPSRAACAHEPL